MWPRLGDQNSKRQINQRLERLPPRTLHRRLTLRRRAPLRRLGMLHRPLNRNDQGDTDIWCEGQGPIFGGARLPNGLGSFPKRSTGAALGSDRSLTACRAAGPRFAMFARRRWLIVTNNLAPTAARSWAQRLGGLLAVAASRPYKCHRPCWSRFGRSGASPHHCSDGAAYLMTKIKTFVPYFKYLVVPL